MKYVAIENIGNGQTILWNLGNTEEEARAQALIYSNEFHASHETDDSYFIIKPVSAFSPSVITTIKNGESLVIATPDSE